MPSKRNDAPARTDQCRECDRAVAPDANFCPGCGADLDDPSGPARCPECGERFDDDDRFCPNCGTARAGDEPTAAAPDRPAGATRPPSRSASSPREGDRAFRRRVQDHLDAGWEVERDDGDRVVLVDRGIGSAGVHVLLLLTTSGVGNLLYGWWHYSKLAERRRLVRGDSTPVRAPSSAEAGERMETVSAYVLTALLLLIGGWITAIAAASGSSPGALVGLAFAILGVGTAPVVRRRLDRRHGVTAFGRQKTVDHRVARPPESIDEPCVVCGDQIDRGLVRRRRDETVVAGVPVRTHSMQRNHYCVDCARSEVFGGDIEPPLDGPERDDGKVDASTDDSTDEPAREATDESLREATDTTE